MAKKLASSRNMNRLRTFVNRICRAMASEQDVQYCRNWTMIEARPRILRSPHVHARFHRKLCTVAMKMPVTRARFARMSADSIPRYTNLSVT